MMYAEGRGYIVKKEWTGSSPAGDTQSAWAPPAEESKKIRTE
jgi:hypothetical protein